MSPVRLFALITGILFLLVGLLGFVPALVSAPAPTAADEGLRVHAFHGYLLGVFPVNLLHNIVHLLVGAAGLVASRTFSASRLFARALAVFYALLAIMGLFPTLNNVFGLIPIHGHDVWLHAATAIVAAYFGWAYEPLRAEDTRTTPMGPTGPTGV